MLVLFVFLPTTCGQINSVQDLINDHPRGDDARRFEDDAEAGVLIENVLQFHDKVWGSNDLLDDGLIGEEAGSVLCPWVIRFQEGGNQELPRDSVMVASGQVHPRVPLSFYHSSNVPRSSATCSRPQAHAIDHGVQKKRCFHKSETWLLNFVRSRTAGVPQRSAIRAQF